MTTAAIEIRSFEPSDYANAFALWQSCEGIGLNESDTEQSITLFLSRNPGLSAVAVTSNGRVVGAVLCGHDGRRGYLHHLAVAGDFRDQGVARRLIEFCMGKLAAEQIVKCNIFVFNDNHSGSAFWLHNGWNEVTWRPLQRRVF